MKTYKITTSDHNLGLQNLGTFSFETFEEIKQKAISLVEEKDFCIYEEKEAGFEQIYCYDSAAKEEHFC
jgi:hypothetical protein